MTFGQLPHLVGSISRQLRKKLGFLEIKRPPLPAPALRHPAPPERHEFAKKRGLFSRRINARASRGNRAQWKDGLTIRDLQKGVTMSVSMAQELAGLHRLTVPELRARYVQAFGAAPPSHRKTGSANASPGGCKRQQKVICPCAACGPRSWPRTLFAGWHHPTTPRFKRPAPKDAIPLNTLRLSTAAPCRQPRRGNWQRSSPSSATAGHAAHPYLAKAKPWQNRGRSLPRAFSLARPLLQIPSAVAKTITGQHCNGFYFFRNAKESS